MLEQYYELQTLLLRLTRRQEALNEEIKQAKFDLRSRDERLLNYQGSLRSLLDKASGTREEKLETLRSHVRRAEAQLKALLREQQALEEQLTGTRQALADFPEPEVLRSEGEETLWASLEAKFCAEALAPLLEENHKALLEYRSLLQGSRMELLTVEERQQIEAAPNVRAEQCRPYLLRLKESLGVQGIPLEPGSYYDSPAAYLVSVAAKHNRFDRVNGALAQVEAMQKKIRQYQ